jgi:glutathione synthase/RimK-type ligase-like ATP-grasp enzyme
MSNSMATIHILHENDEWYAPLAAALDSAKLPHVSWHMGEGCLDLGQSPPSGIFFNRMSASAHTRGHVHAPDYTAAVVAWLERHRRRVINGSAALRLEMSKVAQYHLLESFGFATPRTVVARGPHKAREAARLFDGPFITKHNRSGKGLGVYLFHNERALEQHLASKDFVEPVDGLLLLQEYIQSPDSFITRLEFVGGRFFYALRVDASGGFELCPADSCAIQEQCALMPTAKFAIVDERQPDVPRYEAMLKASGVEVAGIECIRDRQGRVYTYDINVNTNYNAEAEQKAGKSALTALCDFLGRELAKISVP